MSQSSKCIESFDTFSEQIGSLLTNKQLDQAEVLCQKALARLNQNSHHDSKAVTTRFLVAFLRLFTLCPSNLWEGLFKKYLALLRDIHLIKNRISIKCDCLLPALLQVSQKKYFKEFQAYSARIKARYSITSRDEIMNLTCIPRGPALRDVVGLFKKLMERDRQAASRGEDYCSSLIQAYLSSILLLIEQSKNAKKTLAQLQFSFRFFILKQLLEIIYTKFEGILANELNRMLQHYLASTHLDQKIENQAILLFLWIVQFKKSLPNLQKQERLFYNPQKQEITSYFLDCLSAIQIFIDPNLQKSPLNLDLWNKLFLMRKRCIVSLSQNDSLKEETILNLIETSIAELIQRFRFHGKNTQNKRIAPFKIASILIGFSEEVWQLKGISNNPFFLFESKVFYTIQNISKNYSNLGLYLVILFWKMATFDVQDYVQLLSLQQQLCKQLNQMQTRSSIHQMNQKEMKKIYFDLSLNMSFKRFDEIVFSGKQTNAKKQMNVFEKINYLVKQIENSQNMISQIKIKIRSQIASFKQQQCNFQDLLDFVSAIFSLVAQQRPKCLIQEQNLLNFSQFSVVLIDKLNINPVEFKKSPPQLSFLLKQKQELIKLAQWIIIQFHQHNDLLRSNEGFLNSIPTIQLASNEKIITFALKKHLSIYFSKINEIVLRKWIASRQYFTIWCMLLCGFKVKTIFDQMSKCGIGPKQLQAFFNIQMQIIKEFTEYCVTKDRHKFRLLLWEKQITDREELLDSGIANLLIANYNKFLSNGVNIQMI